MKYSYIPIALLIEIKNGSSVKRLYQSQVPKVKRQYRLFEKLHITLIKLYFPKPFLLIMITVVKKVGSLKVNIPAEIEHL